MLDFEGGLSLEHDGGSLEIDGNNWSMNTSEGGCQEELVDVYLGRWLPGRIEPFAYR